MFKFGLKWFDYIGKWWMVNKCLRGLNVFINILMDEIVWN